MYGEKAGLSVVPRAASAATPKAPPTSIAGCGTAMLPSAVRRKMTLQ